MLHIGLTFICMKRFITFSTGFIVILLFAISCGDQSQSVTTTGAGMVDGDSSAVYTVSVDELKIMLDSSQTDIIIDVRTPEETAEGMIKGAMQIDVRSNFFENHISALDKERSYVVYCRSGKRSSKAVEIMQKQGFTHLINVEGGYLAWLELEK